MLRANVATPDFKSFALQFDCFTTPYKLPLKLKQLLGFASRLRTNSMAAASNTAGVELGVLNKFPAEIRNEIYRHAVVYDSPVDLFKIDELGRVTRGTIRPALAKTSKQIQEEVLPIFYAENTFALLGDIRRSPDRTTRFDGDAEHWMRSLQSFRQDGQEYLRYVSRVQSVAAADLFHVGDRKKVCYVVGKLTERAVWIDVTCRNAGEGWCRCRKHSERVRPDIYRTAEQRVMMALIVCRRQLMGFASRGHCQRCKKCGLLK